MASLQTILIVGPDTVAAALPATPVQLVHACREWGFSLIVPASWGDELIATEVIRRCAARDNRPVVQCSCPLVAERLSSHATMLDDAVLWLAPPPVAVAKYLRHTQPGENIHITYAGNCSGATDPSIDERIDPGALLAALGARGVDLARQPTVFDNLIPADRRRHASSPGGVPEQHKLWEAASFRVAQPRDGEWSLDVAQLLMRDERLLIDLSRAMDCTCRRAEPQSPGDGITLHRSPSPVVVSGVVDLSRPAPVQPSVAAPAAVATTHAPARPPAEADPIAPVRAGPLRPSFRRQSVWRRQSPRPGIIVARPSGVTRAVDSRPRRARPTTRWIVGALLIGSGLLVGILIGRRRPPLTGSVGETGPIPHATSTPLAHLRSLS